MPGLKESLPIKSIQGDGYSFREILSDRTIRTPSGMNPTISIYIGLVVLPIIKTTMRDRDNISIKIRIADT